MEKVQRLTQVRLFFFVEGKEELIKQGETITLFSVNIILTCCHKNVFCSVKGKFNKVSQKGTLPAEWEYSKRKME